MIDSTKALYGPLNRMGSAAITPTAMAALAGVLNRGWTCPHAPPKGRCRSRPMENMSRLAAPWMARVQTKTDTRMTSR